MRCGGGERRSDEGARARRRIAHLDAARLRIKPSAADGDDRRGCAVDSRLHAAEGGKRGLDAEPGRVTYASGKAVSPSLSRTTCGLSKRWTPCA